MPLHISDIALENKQSGARIEGRLFIGSGIEIVQAVARETHGSESAILESILNRLLVNKGADWNATILSEYLGLYPDSRGTFALALDRASNALVAHGALFQSAAHPGTGLLAHIRTADEAKRLGLGSLVSRELTRSALERGAHNIVLGTDDPTAHALYGKIGYADLAAKKHPNGIDWLMVINRTVFEQCNAAEPMQGAAADEIRLRQNELVQGLRQRYSAAVSQASIHPVSSSDLASLFLFLNLGPDPDFHLKLHSWGVQKGPEFERAFVVSARPAIMDRDRLEDASLVLRDESGAIVALCAARLETPFTRNTLQLDFYCLPAFLHNNPLEVSTLVNETMRRISKSALRPKPCFLSFVGMDGAKIGLFQKLGFTKNGNSISLHPPDGPAIVAHEYSRRLD